MRRGFVAGAMAIFGFVFMLDGSVHGGKDPLSIKVIMQKAMKSGLSGKVVLGTATEEEKTELISLLKNLAENKPPKGDEADWKQRTKTLLDAATKNDSAALKKASNCTACHKAHKP